jgi:hypothetical protein
MSAGAPQIQNRRGRSGKSLVSWVAITAGWKAKSLPPFRPVYELTLNRTLPANILDGFHTYSSNEKLEDWVDAIETVEEVDKVAERVLNELCSGRWWGGSWIRRSFT